MLLLSTVAEQAAGDGHRSVVAVCTAAGVPACQRWRDAELRLADAASEAQDTVKYLTTLESSLECIYTSAREGWESSWRDGRGSIQLRPHSRPEFLSRRVAPICPRAELPSQIQDSLPLIATNLRMVHSLSRHYSQPAHLATYLHRLANQLIKRCRQHILAGGSKLWEQPDRPALVEALRAACALHTAYVEHAGKLLPPSRPQGSGSCGAPWADRAPGAPLSKFALFSKRCSKLAGMFATAHQFAQLAQSTHIQGVADVLAKFWEVVEDLKRRPYDLLDYSRTQFDRDLLEWDVHINDLELGMQVFGSVGA